MTVETVMNDEYYVLSLLCFVFYLQTSTAPGEEFLEHKFVDGEEIFIVNAHFEPLQLETMTKEDILNLNVSNSYIKIAWRLDAKSFAKCSFLCVLYVPYTIYTASVFFYSHIRARTHTHRFCMVYLHFI